MNRNIRIGLLMLIPMTLFALIAGPIIFLAIATGGRGVLRGAEQAEFIICGVGMLLTIPVIAFLLVLPYVAPRLYGGAPRAPNYLAPLMGVGWTGAALLLSASFFLRAYLEDRPGVSDAWRSVRLALFCLGILSSWIVLGLPVLLRRSLLQGQQAQEPAAPEEPLDQSLSSSQ